MTAAPMLYDARGDRLMPGGSAILRKAQPSIESVHINRTLTSMSIAYMQDQSKYVAGRIFPVVPVEKQSDLYWEFPRAFWLSSSAKMRAPATESAGSGWTQTTSPYYANVYGVHLDIPDQVRANSDLMGTDKAASMWVTDQLLLLRESIWISKFFVTGVWGTESTPSPLWSAANSTPIKDIRAKLTAIERKTGRRPNIAVMGPDVFDVLVDHPDFIARVNSGQTPVGPAIVNAQTMAEVLGLDEVLVVRSVQVTAVEGNATQTVDFQAGKHLLVAYRTPTPQLMMPSAGYTFAWTGYLGNAAMGTTVYQFRLDRIKADRVEGEMAFDMKITGADLGHLFLSAVS
jgi:hypothetical protein